MSQPELPPFTRPHLGVRRRLPGKKKVSPFSLFSGSNAWNHVHCDGEGQGDSGGCEKGNWEGDGGKGESKLF